MDEQVQLFRGHRSHLAGFWREPLIGSFSLLHSCLLLVISSISVVFISTDHPRLRWPARRRGTGRWRGLGTGLRTHTYMDTHGFLRAPQAVSLSWRYFQKGGWLDKTASETASYLWRVSRLRPGNFLPRGIYLDWGMAATTKSQGCRGEEGKKICSWDRYLSWL